MPRTHVRTPVPNGFRITRLPVAASPVTADGWHRGAGWYWFPVSSDVGGMTGPYRTREAAARACRWHHAYDVRDGLTVDDARPLWWHRGAPGTRRYRPAST